MRWREILTMSLAACFLNGKAVSDELPLIAEQALPVCELLASPNTYAGREVEVVGIYGRSHGRILFDPVCPSVEVEVRIEKGTQSRKLDSDLQDSLIQKAKFRMKVTYRGRVKTDPILGCEKADCYRTVLEESRIVSVEKVPASQ